MYKWYERSKRCYVYLSDIPCRTLDITRQEVPLDSFLSSRWFTRGWTLQELLAPRTLVFFSANGDLLGYRSTFSEGISHQTQIPRELVENRRPAGSYSVESIIRWIENRKTKREEDAAYSLLGILGVQMPLIYGEGRKRAFARLRLESYRSRHPNPLPEVVERLRKIARWTVCQELVQLGHCIYQILTSAKEHQIQPSTCNSVSRVSAKAFRTSSLLLKDFQLAFLGTFWNALTGRIRELLTKDFILACQCRTHDLYCTRCSGVRILCQILWWLGCSGIRSDSFISMRLSLAFPCCFATECYAAEASGISKKLHLFQWNERMTILGSDSHSNISLESKSALSRSCYIYRDTFFRQQLLDLNSYRQ